MSAQLADIVVVEDWESPRWRLNSGLFSIVDAAGELVPFHMNDSQQEFYDELWYRNLVLKGRQQGFSTLVGLMALDQCLFNRTFRSGIIAQTMPDCTKLFRNKIERPYMALPEDLRKRIGKVRSNATELVLGNGSSIQVSMSMRGDTLNLLHVSEFAKICRQFPERAREIITGAFKTLGNGQILIVESTAEGEGAYKDFCDEATALQAAGKTLTEKDFRLHFFPWWRKDANRLNPEGVEIDENMQQYFDDLQTKHGVPPLDDWQKAWYVKEAAILRGDMHREEPSYPEEAFAAHIQGAIYAKEMAFLRKQNRIRTIPWEPALPVHSFWDFGVSTNNETTVWLMQKNGSAYQFIHYYEKEGEGIAHFVKHLQDWASEMGDVVWGTDFLPHDGATRIQAEQVETREEIMNRLGRRNTVIVPRTKDVKNGIELTQERMPQCWFDAEGCARGIAALDNYVRKFDKQTSRFTVPLHNWASNGSDSFRQFGQAFNVIPNQTQKRKPARASNWKVV